MKIYKVGGCVRDYLMKVPARDVDWLVVGATPAQLAAAGYVQVGADFPVFLHPETKEEYALARKERKVGLGHKGFETTFDSSVTVEEDLSRRDLTINAMAMDTESGAIIDPFGGQRDLHASILRHVSDAFSEDPLRVLRLARFQARTGFSVAPETFALCAELCARGALRELSVERVCSEMRKLLESSRADEGLSTLVETGALASLDPSWPSRLGPAQRAAVKDAATRDLPEWARARLAFCSGQDADSATRTLEALRFPNDLCKWSARVGALTRWATETGPDEPIDFDKACAVLERCGAPKLTEAELLDFASCAELELASWSTPPWAVQRAISALGAASAIASADLSAALAGPKKDLPAAVRRAKSAALAASWESTQAPASRPKL